MLTRSIIVILIGTGAIVVASVLNYVIFVKPEAVVPVQPVVENIVNNDVVNPTTIPTTTPTTLPFVEDDDIPELDTSDWKVYRNEEYGFEVKYPKNWVNKNSESVRLFSEGGPIGNRSGFRAVEKTIYGNPFWVNIYYISNVKNIEELEYFDFVHSGDIVYYDDYDIIRIGPNQEKFFKIKEKFGSYIAIKIKDENYFQISYQDPKIDSLRDKADQIVSTFKFIE